MKKKLTIKDIAKEFGVSVSTVSKALNDSHEISIETKAKIQKYAKEQKYKPNFNALSLKQQRSKTIGVIIPNMLKYVYAQVFNGIEKVANENGYKIITCVSNESAKKEVETVQMLSNGSIDGFILSMAIETAISKDYEHFHEIVNEDIPIVMFDRVSYSFPCDTVIIEDEKGTYKAVEHLYNIGCKNIAFVGTNVELKSHMDRKKGYLRGLKDYNLHVNEDLIIEIEDNNYKNFETHILPHFERNQGQLDAVITTNETTGIAAQKVAQKLGFKIPENFNVIAFSNGIIARHANPKLTTISQHGEKMGEVAAQLLIDRLEKDIKENYQNVEIKTDIVERNSTKMFLKLNR